MRHDIKAWGLLGEVEARDARLMAAQALSASFAGDGLMGCEGARASPSERAPARLSRPLRANFHPASARRPLSVSWNDSLAS